MLGERLRALRKKNGWTQKQIAEMLHINRSTYAYYETGATQPDLDMFRRLAILFEVSTDDLLGLSPPPPDMEEQLFLYVASLPLIKRRGFVLRLQSLLKGDWRC